MRVDLVYGQTAPPLEPTDDDQGTRNDVTVSRPGGSSARVIAETGPLSVLAPPDGVGRYDESVDLEAETDDQLPSLARWRVHVGTWDEARYPSVTVDLTARPELVDDIAELETGDRLVIADPPVWLPPEAIDLLVDGYSETLGSHGWTWTANTSPYGPYRVGELPDANGNGGAARLDTSGSELVTAAGEADTALSVYTVQDNPDTPRALWITSGGPAPSAPADFPFDARMGGERVTVTAVEPGAWDTFTRTESGGWGTSPSGHAWAVEGGLASDYAMSSVGATHSVAEAGGATRRSLLDLGLADLDVVWSVSIPEVSSGVAAQAGLLIREDGTNNNFYVFRLLFLTNGNIDARISKRVNAVETTLINPSGAQGGYDGGFLIHVRCQAHGPDLRMRCWVEGSFEPLEWQAVASDDTFPGPGRVGLRSAVDAGWTGPLPLTFTYQDFTVTNPQAFTVARSVNGIAKPHTAGTAVSLARPVVVAL